MRAAGGEQHVWCPVLLWCSGRQAAEFASLRTPPQQGGVLHVLLAARLLLPPPWRHHSSSCGCALILMMLSASLGMLFCHGPPSLVHSHTRAQVYEYDRNLLQQDAVQYIAAYKYEVTTISTALNMHLYVRQRPPLLRKQQGGQRGGTGAGGGTAGGIGSSSGPGSGSGGGLFPPKPGASGGQGRRPGFSVANVLNSMGVGAQQQQPAAGAAGQQQQQRPLRTPPRSPGGELQWV